MRKFKHRVWLGAILVLSLLVNVVMPAPAAEAEAAPDLIVEEIVWSPEAPLLGDTVIFTVTIRNQGDVPSGAASVDCYIDDSRQISLAVAPLETGAALDKNFTWVAEAGSHTVAAAVNAADSVAESDEDNNRTAFAFSVLAPDLIVEAVTWSPEEPSDGDQVDFTVTIKNQGNAYARFSQVKVYVDGNYRGYEEVPRLEAGENVTFTFTWKARVGSQYVEVFADALEHVSESDETNNTRAVICSTATPDLYIDSITWTPENPTENTTVTVSIMVANRGLGMAGQSYMSYCLDSISQYSLLIPQIEAGENVTETFLWPVTYGYHEVSVAADINDRVMESDETNNVLTVPLPSPSPDLVVQSITCSPSSPVLKHQVTLSITVKNQGKSTAAASSLDVYISGYDPYQLAVPQLSAGGTASLSLPFTVKQETSTVEAVADAEGWVGESNEENNTKTVNITATVSTTKPDLVIESITWLPSVPVVGEKLTFTVSVGNDGTAGATPSHVAYYIDDVWQDDDYIGDISAGANTTASFEWVAVGGTHTFKAVADANGAVGESKGSNNDKTVTLSVPAPDLVIQGVAWSPVIPAAGETVNFTVTVANRGSRRAICCGVDYYVDGASRGSHNIEEIAANATATTFFTWTAQAGRHVIGVVADGAGQIAEIDEANNRRDVAIPAPDLIIQDITWSPEEPSENATVTFTVTAGNQGAGVAGGSRVYYYVDDAAAGCVSLTEINTGAAAKAVFTWQAQPGSHVIRVAADGDDLVTESDESNNEKAVELSVLPPDSPDLAAVTGAAATAVGLEVTVEEDVSATPGDGAAPAAEDGLSPDAAAAEATETTPLQRAISKWWYLIAIGVLVSIAVSVFVCLRGRISIPGLSGRLPATGKSAPPEQAPDTTAPSGN